MTILPADDSPLGHVEAINNIKKLQHRFGYLLHDNNWNDATQLFTEDAVLHVANHEPAIGQNAIREHLPEAYDLDLLQPVGSAFLASPKGHLHQVRAHLQIMPVITIAPGAQTAQGTWRHLGLGGGPGQSSFWAEGPQEVSYRYQEGTWRISRLRWARHFIVPYTGGWQTHVDQAQKPSKDSAFSTWPTVQRSELHFLDTSPFYSSANVSKSLRDDLLEGDTDPKRDYSRIQRLKATRDIENLQGILGYYLDKHQWTQAASLFTADARLVHDAKILASGYAQILRLFRQIGPEGATPGRLFDLIHLQPEIEVLEKEARAQGRWTILAQLAVSGQAHEWGLAVLEVDYIHTALGWRIDQLTIREAAFTDYELGWGRDRQTNSEIVSRLTLSTNAQTMEQATSSSTTPVPISDESSSQTSALKNLQWVIATQDIERLQYVYGYYLAEFLWDELTELFTNEGTLEIALRGVYRGRRSIRRSLELYGSTPEHGVLHNHMQFQPVIHLDPKQDTAYIRARALSMMGRFQESATWMGGIYENELRFDNNRWKMHLDKMTNTYFAPYTVGWKDLPLRSAPGVSDAIPPDERPTRYFEMYPAAHFVPPHYPAL